MLERGKAETEEAVGDFALSEDLHAVVEPPDLPVDPAEHDPADDKVPGALKALAVGSILLGFATVAVAALIVVAIVVGYFGGRDFAVLSALDLSTQALVLNIVYAAANTLLSAWFVVFGIRLLLNKRRFAARQTIGMIAAAALVSLLSLMCNGVGWTFAFHAAVLIFLAVMHTYLDPSLAQERQLQIKLQQMEARSDGEAGVLGRDKTGRGYIALNFFNIFWIFVVGCVLGWAFEMTVCPFMNGRIEDRTGMLWGPFSPIYGFGGLLMTIALNRFYKSNPVIVYLVSALIGAGFEFLVSYFFQYAFGIMAWDYSGEPFNLQGRTDLFHALAWGALGLVFIRWILPAVLELINRIPWNWRYAVTSVCFAAMLANGVMTMLAFDCWFQRVSGQQPDTPVAQFFADNFDNDFMAKHFPTMSIDPSRATHG